MRKFHIAAYSVLIMFAVGGCSPSSSPPRQREDLDSVREIKDGLDELANQLSDPNTNSWELGNSVADKIACVTEDRDRRDCLSRLENVVLSAKVEGRNYAEKRMKFSEVRALHNIYCNLLVRCHEESGRGIQARLAFLDRMRRDLGQEVSAVPEDTRSGGLHWSKEMYYDSLRNDYDLHMRWLEEFFNRLGTNAVSYDVREKLRMQIEKAIGRRIRTKEEIRRDRRIPSRVMKSR